MEVGTRREGEQGIIRISNIQTHFGNVVRVTAEGLSRSLLCAMSILAAVE